MCEGWCVLVEVRGRPVGPGNCTQVLRLGGMSPAFYLIYSMVFLKHTALMGCRALRLKSPPNLFPSWPWTNANIWFLFVPRGCGNKSQSRGRTAALGESLQHPDCEQVSSQAFVETLVLKTHAVFCPFLLSLGETDRVPGNVNFRQRRVICT